MSAGKGFGQRLIRGVDRFRPDATLLSPLQESGITNAAVREHPCIFQLPSIRLPERLDRAAIEVLKEVNIAPKHLLKKASVLTKYLWRRTLPFEGERQRELYRRFEEHQTEWNEDIEDEDEARRFLKKEKKELDRIVRQEVSEWRPLRYSNLVAPVYLVAKLSPNFATTCRVLYEIRKRCPEFHPKSLFDFGTGLGTVVWAANSVWPEGSLQEHYVVDTSAPMLKLAEQLFRGGSYNEHTPTCFPGIHGRQFLPASPEPRYDLVVAGGSLIDIGMSRPRKMVLRTLWEKTETFLVLIEMGTKAGFQAILEARNFILKEYGPCDNNDPESAAYLFSPCPHSQTCPKATSVCNFYVTYQELNLTTPSVNYKKEVFSYVIFSKGLPPTSETDNLSLSRIVTYKPTKTKHQSLHDVCTSEGTLERVSFSKKTTNKFLYGLLSRGRAGDRIPAELQSLDKSKDFDPAPQPFDPGVSDNVSDDSGDTFK